MKLAVAVCAAMLTTAALAQDAPIIDPLDFMVEWPNMIGQTVIIKKGRITFASEMQMVLTLQGGVVGLDPPWKDRADLRYLFQHCTEIITDEKCDAAVQGTIGKNPLANMPTLKNVDFFNPVN